MNLGFDEKNEINNGLGGRLDTEHSDTKHNNIQHNNN
jgi:hypothetical protein